MDVITKGRGRDIRMSRLELAFYLWANADGEWSVMIKYTIQEDLSGEVGRVVWRARTEAGHEFQAVAIIQSQRDHSLDYGHR